MFGHLLLDATVIIQKTSPLTFINTTLVMVMKLMKISMNFLGYPSNVMKIPPGSTED